LALVALAVGVTLTLIPHGREMALLRMQAGDPQGAVTALQRMVDNGDRSPATLSALARALARAGNSAAAAKLLEGLAAERPGDRAVLETLAGLQRDAGLSDGLLTTLQALQAIAPRVEWQRELARLLGDTGRMEDRRQALRALVERFKAEPVDYVDLAQAEQAAGDPAAGAAVLQSLAERHPGAADASVVALQVRMLLAAGNAERALQRAQQWLAGRNDLPRVAPIIGGALGAGGHPDLAVALLQPLAGPGAAPELVAALAQAESDAGHPEQALTRLEQLGATGSANVALLRLRLAVALRETDRAMAAAEIAGLRRLTPDLLAGLSRIALTSGRTDAIRRILDTAGDGFLNTNSVLAAQIQLALGNMEAARRWSERAALEIAGEPEQMLELADVEFRLGRIDVALNVLGRALSEPALSPDRLSDIARFYIRSGHPMDGARALDALRQRRSSPAADGAWALAATAAGQANDVMAWLSTHGAKNLSPDTLRDLAYLAMDARSTDLALRAAEQLFALKRGASEGVLLARALLNAKQARRALDQLRALPPDASVPDDLREAVLLDAWHQGALVAEELRGIWAKHLAAATTPSERNAAVSILLELKAYPEVVPALRQLAEQNPVKWVAVYSEAAAAAGRRAELPAFWHETAMKPAVPADLRRQLAFRLLEVGDKPLGEQVFRVLAAAAPPQNPDVRMLLYIWGPRPSPDQLDWIEARARRASGAEKAEWMKTLVDRGAPGRAVAAYRASSPADAREPAAEAYATALEALGDRAALAATVREQFPRTSSLGGLQRLAELAESSRDTDLEWSILNKVVAAGGDRPAVQRRLGTLAFQRRKMAEAERHLMAFVATTGGDYETLMVLGNIALRNRDTDGARAYFARSLAALNASGDKSFRARSVEANLLHRLGKDADADRLYQSLLAEHPGDTNLRADFVAMLMEQGTLQRARAVLDQQ
jgi:predicted Zn-dependent protease